MDLPFVTGREDLVSVEHQLYNVAIALGACRKQLRRLCDNQSGLENRCLAAEQGYAQCAQAYQHLFDQHQATTRDLAETAGRCRSLEREAESAQTAMLALESIDRRSERRDAADAVSIKQEADCTAGSSCAQSHAAIASLEKDKAELRGALTRAADVICGLTQRVDSLQSTQCSTEPNQTEGVKNTARSGDLHKETPPVRRASTRRVRPSRKRKSS